MSSTTSCTASRRPTEEFAKCEGVGVLELCMNDANQADNTNRYTQDTTHGENYGGAYSERDETTRASPLLLEKFDVMAAKYIKESGLNIPAGVLPSTIFKKYKQNLDTVVCIKARVKGRRWIDSVQAQAIAATLSCKSKKHWFGPTLGSTRLDRHLHRHRKRVLSNIAFCCLLTYDSITTCNEYGEEVRIIKNCKHSVKSGGYKAQGEYSLFAQYIARVEQLSTVVVPGHTAYTPLHREEFDRMSRKRQLFELKRIGLAVDSVDDAHKLFIHADERYPSTHTTYAIPELRPIHMTTADILHHHHHITAKITGLRRLQRESRREATRALRRHRRISNNDSGAVLSIGAQRARNIYLINRAISGHTKLKSQLELQLKLRYKVHNKSLDQRYINTEAETIEPAVLEQQSRIIRTTSRGCRRHIRKHHVEDEVSDGRSDVEENEPPTFLQELRRYRLRRWEQRSSKIHYRTAHDRVGGLIHDKMSHYIGTEGTITVCTVNVRGFDESDNKLELILQFCEDENIDVMVCIDAQLDEKRGHWYGKIAKRRLGVGTRTNNNPCIIEHGDGLGKGRRVGGIFMIVRPRWGTSLVKFQKDKFGPDDSSIGIMSQVTLATQNAQLNIIGSYWPNRHSPGSSSDTTLWNGLQRYVRLHKFRDGNPIELLQRVSQQWVATAYKNGARGSILCGDLNATWTGNESGGQTVLQNWAEAFSLRNGIRRVAQRLHCDMYTRGGDGQPHSWIDHVLHKGAATYIDCLAGYTSQAPEWVGISDHKPIWGIYKVHPPLQKCPKKSRLTKVRYELQLTDRQKCDEFVEAMEKLLDIPAPTDDSNDEEVIEYMRKIEQHSGSTVKRLYQRHGQTANRSTRKDGWSPSYIAYKVHLTSLVEIRRSLFGHAHRRKWTTLDDMRQDLPDILHIWESTLDGLELSKAHKADILSATEHPIRWWKELDSLPDAGVIDADIELIKKLIHGTSRTELRRRINGHIRKREDSRKEGKWKRVISSLLGNLAGRRHQPGIDLNLIANDDDNVLGEAKAIHEAITDKFEEWFDDPDYCQGDLHQGDNWTNCRDSETYFLQDTAYTGAPEDLRRLIHRAISHVPQRQRMRDELAESFKRSPTLAEFEIAIQNAKTNSSAGMSGCSYNQLKKWPPGLIKNLHYCLSRIWQTQGSPSWWSSRWLVVIPKKPEEIPHVGNMRPLILVEAVRKIWCKLFLQRILGVWQKYNALHRYQHGFIRGRSTMTASTLFINLIEDAIENDRPIHTCTWDITKAFDSVSKNVMKLAWTRLGVPDDWAQWLVGLDVNGTTTVRTPYAVDIWNQKGSEGLKLRRRKRTRAAGNSQQYSGPGSIAGSTSEDTSGEGFHAIRGTGQGDVTSPTCWAAIFDILLTALHLDIQDKRRHVSADANRGYVEGETAYADDLLSCARTPEALQRKADIVSTFCMIMGLQLSTSKLRRFVMAHSGLEDDEYTTIIHRYNNSPLAEDTWAADEITANTHGVLEYLGGKYDTDSSCRSVLTDMRQIAMSHCAEIGNTAASTTTKIACANMTTYAKLRYKAKLSSTTLAELDGIDKIFYQFHTKATKNMKSFPYDLMYQLPSNGGVGLQQFSDLTSLDKLSEMFRALSRADETRHAMCGTLQRIARHQGHHILSDHRYRYQHKRGIRSWLRSATEWLQKYNLYLWRGGVKPTTDSLCSPIAMVIPELTSLQLRKLSARRIYHLSDIVDDRSGYREWSIPRQDDWLRTLLPDEPPTDGSSILWPGQFWQPYVDCEGLRPTNVLEVVHVIDDYTMEICIWRMSSIHGDQIKYTKADDTVIVDIRNVFRGSTTERWDQVGLRGTTCSFQRSRIVPTPRANVELPQSDPEWVQQAVQFCTAQGPTYRPRIYTDGSYLEKDYDIHSVFDKEAVTKKSSAGIAIIHDGSDWRDRPIYAMHIPYGDDIGCKSAYTMEYLALAIAMRLQSSSLKVTAVCSDSKAALKRIANRRVHLGKADESHRFLLQSIDNSIKGGATIPRWVPSHPERRKPDTNNWLQDDWGNYIADKVAGHGVRALRGVHSNVQWHSISAIDIINTLPRRHEYYFGDAAGRPIALYGVMDHIYKLRLQRYITRRDWTNPGAPKWADGTITFAAATFNGSNASEGQCAHTARLIWDKHWHGRNRAKQRLSDNERSDVSLCHMCKEIDSQHHCFQTCQHSNVRAIRDETAQALRIYEQQHTRWLPDVGTEDEHILTLGLIRGIIHEFHHCVDAGRVWTGNWNRAMIDRLQTNFGRFTITKKMCRRLRGVVAEMYEIISQGTNDIMDVRHGVQNAQELHLRQGRIRQETATSAGRRTMLDYLQGTSGLTGLQLRAQQALSDSADLESTGSSQCEDERIGYMPWLRQTEQGRVDNRNILAGVQHDHQILAQIDKYCIRAGSLRRVQQGREIDAPIVDGYLRLLQSQAPSSIKCMGSSFFSRLYNPAGEIRHMPRNTFNLAYASQHFNRVDVFQYHHIIIPILVRRHWSLIVVDTMSKQLRYLDSQGGDGTEFLAVIKRWLANRWRVSHYEEFNFDEWRSMPFNWAHIPQQTDRVNCGVFLLMFAELIARGEDISQFSGKQCDCARQHILHRILASESQSDIHVDDRDTPSVIMDIAPSTQQSRVETPTPVRRGSLTSHKYRSTMTRSSHVVPTPVQVMCASPISENVTSERNVDRIISDIETLQPGGWLTDMVITRYFELLQARSDTDGSQQLFLSAQFYNRLFDSDTSTIRRHLRSHDTTRNHEGLTDLDMLRQMHGHMDLIHCTRAYVPVAQRQHWGLLEVDNITRTITYFDSLRNGGAHYGRAMRDYITQYEDEVGLRNDHPWRVRYSIRPGLPLHGLCQVPVPTQQNGNDCGVFLCLFADLLSRQQDIMQFANLDMEMVRIRIRQSLHESKAYMLSDQGQHQEAESTMPNGYSNLSTTDVDIQTHQETQQLEADTLPLDTMQSLKDGDSAEIKQNINERGLRRSSRTTKYSKSMTEAVTAVDVNYHRLTIRKSKDMGWGLYATDSFSYSTDRVICTYHGRKISAHQAKNKTNKSRYVVELLGANQRYVYIDGFDELTQLCYSAGPYANDGIHESHRRDLWNAELTVDEFNPDVFVLRPLRDIQAGEQIYVWYGPRYWCSDDYSLEEMCNAVITYGIDITTSTSDTYGNWRRLKKYRALLELLDAQQYVPPVKVTDLSKITSIPSMLISSLAEATMEELPFSKLPTIQPMAITSYRPATVTPSIAHATEKSTTDQLASTVVHATNEISPNNPSMLGKEDSDDDGLLLPLLGQSHNPLPRFRVGSNPTTRRNKLFGSKARHKSAEGCGIKRTFTTAFDTQYTTSQRLDTSVQRRRLQDQDVTAPDAVIEEEVVVENLNTVSPPAIPHVHIDVSNNQPKRKVTQAKLRDYYRDKRPRSE